jgi:hypothetical protein
MEIFVNGARRTIPEDVADPAHALFCADRNTAARVAPKL